MKLYAKKHHLLQNIGHAIELITQLTFYEVFALLLGMQLPMMNPSEKKMPQISGKNFNSEV